jgi:proline iminopeptidase
MTKTVSTQDPTAPRRELYPPIEPYDIGRLRVSDIHELYYEQVKNEYTFMYTFTHTYASVSMP